VPGTVSGLETALARYGSKKRAALIAPAIALARTGFVLEPGDADMLSDASADLAKDGPSAAIFLDHGHAWAAGRRLVQADLARTLERIRDHGEAGFYRGPVADAIVHAARAAKGIISAQDLVQYRTRERAPIECEYRGYHIVSAPPPSSGGVILCEMLHVLEGYPLQELGYGSARALHVEIETMRRAYRDRNRYLGDPDFVANPVAQLLDKSYAAALRATIDPEKAGDPADASAGNPGHEGSNTTHYSIVDHWGNAVAVTYTLNRWFGARVMAPGTGVLLNDEMDDFTTKEGAANSFGLVQGAANLIAPGKRPLSSMTPTIVTRDGQPLLIIGTPGGSRIISAVLEGIINVIDYRMDVQEAVNAPRFHQQWRPAETEFEPYAINPDTQKILVAMGHKLVQTRPRNHLAAILVGAPALGAPPVGANRYYGANDPRRNTGLALGY